jgi:hypothetical protein
VILQVENIQRSALMPKQVEDARAMHSALSSRVCGEGAQNGTEEGAPISGTCNAMEKRESPPTDILQKEITASE